MNELWQDVRYAVRLALKSPGFTLATVLTLTIGIGANTAMFSVVYGTLMRPLPFDEPDRLVRIMAASGETSTGIPLADIQRFREATRSFDQAATQITFPYELESDGPPVTLRIPSVTRNFFEVFGVKMAMGRGFQPEDERPDSPLVTIISYGFWQTQFGSDPQILGRDLRLRGQQPLNIIGILPKDFRSPSDLDEPAPAFILLGKGPEVSPGNPTTTFGRLKPGITAEMTQAELSTIQADFLKASSSRIASAKSLEVARLSEFIVRYDRTTILIFAAAVLCVLLVGIVNLVGLELARLPIIQNELAIRASLGAPRSRLIQFMLIKTLVPGVVGGLCGIFLSIAAHSALLAGFPFPRERDIKIDVPVWLFSIGLSILSSVLIAIVPAIRASGLSVREAIHTVARSHTASRKQLFFQDVLTAVETGIAVVLVISAGLLINSFWRLTSVDPGFNPQRLPSVGVTLPASYSLSQKTVYFDEILTRLRVLPGIESIAAAQNLPIDSASYTTFVPAALEAAGEVRPIPSQYNGVTGAYFETLQIPILAGRTFLENETQTDAAIAVVSESFARTMWPRRSPLGQRFTRRRVPGFTFPDLTVVGLVGDIRSRGPVRTSEPSVYISLNLALKEDSGNFGRKVSVVARTSASITNMRQAIAEIDSNALIVTTSMESILARTVARQRFQTTLLASFAVVALMLAALRTYSVLSFSVSRRTREIGVRMAVGARPTQVFAHIFRRALIPAIFGIGGGLAVSYAMRRVLTSYLFQIQPSDAPTYVAVTLTLVLVLLIACALPARRATKLDPMAALRCE